MVSKNDKLGQIVADSEGKTLYLYTKDTKDTSNCYDKCAENWPPLLTTARRRPVTARMPRCWAPPPARTAQPR